jgi:HD-like signal output (HDOD) protein/ActR/RegA family two-component response regulator
VHAAAAPRRILVVDDEPNVVRGLRMVLHSYRQRWNVETRTSGAEALKALESGAFDALITDARMPVMDGEALLRIVAERWPSMLRVVLSGEPGRDGFERLQQLAHHFFSKPVAGALLFQRVEDSLTARARLTTPQVQAVVCRLGALPAMPVTYTAISALAAKEASQLAEFVQVVESDVAVCGAVLRAVNSAWFGLRQSVTSLREAVRLMGLQPLRNLVLAAEVFGGAAPAVDALRREAVQRLAVLPKYLELLEQPCLRDELATAAVLVDVGRLALQLGLPDDAAAIDRRVAAGVTRENLERERLGADHALIGAVMLGIWGLPQGLIDAVALHHETELAASAVPTLTSILSLLCHAQQLEHGSPAIEASTRKLALIHGIEDVSPLRALFGGQAARAA